MPQLEVSTYPSQIFWLLICLFFLLSFVKHVFIPRMNRILEARDKKVFGDLERTKEIKETVVSLEKEYTEKIATNKIKARGQKEQQLKEFEALRASRITQIARAFARKRAVLEKEQLLHFTVEKKFQNILLKR